MPNPKNSFPLVRHNFHTHTHYSDGAAAPRAYVEQAIRQEFLSLGFSDHSPLPFPASFALREEKISDYINEIHSLQFEYSGKIELLAGMEMDYIPGMTEPFSKLKKKHKLDFVIGSVHLVLNDNRDGLWFIDGPLQQTYDDGLKYYFDGDIRKAVGAYWNQIRNMVNTEEFEIIGHLDKIKMHNNDRYFREEEDWYRKMVNETLDEIARKNIIVEVNTRGLYKNRSNSLFPGPTILMEILKRKIPVMLSSDAHKPEEISGMMNESAIFLKNLGFHKLSILDAGGKLSEIKIDG